MAKKIEGFACIDNDGSVIVGMEKNIYINKHCTTVIHEGHPERVFTESEVRAMLRDLIEDQARCDVHNGWQSGMIPDFAGIATKHGVSLDPA